MITTAILAINGSAKSSSEMRRKDFQGRNALTLRNALVISVSSSHQVSSSVLANSRIRTAPRTRTVMSVSTASLTVKVAPRGLARSRKPSVKPAPI